MERALSIEGNSPLGWAMAPLAPAASLYGAAVRMRAALYAGGWLTQSTLPCRVISVGNLTVGGTGKTPVVIALAAALQSRGRKVGVISRGYKRRSESPIFEVSDGKTPAAGGPVETGDEPFLIAQRCPGVPVAVGADRPAVGRFVLERHHVDTLILDDGYQHLALRRDVDILILDAAAPFGNGYLLPRGGLREPLSAAARATAVLVTRASQGRLDNLKAAVAAAAPGMPVWVTDFAPAAVLEVGGPAIKDPAVLKAERVLAVSGIGRPDSFRKLLSAAGGTVVHHCVFPDHHAYSREDVRFIQRNAEGLGVDRIVTTEKDAVKLAEFDETKGTIWAVRIDMTWIEGREEWTRVVLQG